MQSRGFCLNYRTLLSRILGLLLPQPISAANLRPDQVAGGYAAPGTDRDNPDAPWYGEFGKQISHANI